MYGVVIQNKDVEIGNNVSLGLYSLIGKCIIGDDVMFGPYVQIIPG